MSRLSACLAACIALLVLAVLSSSSSSAQSLRWQASSLSQPSNTVSVQVDSFGQSDTYVMDAQNYVNASNVRMGTAPWRPSWAGLRFVLPVPQGATVTSAYLTVRQTYGKGSIPTLTVRAEAADNALDYTNVQPWITDDAHRPQGAASVAWTPAGVQGTTYDSVDLSPVIQEVVNRSGWNANNNLSLIIDGPNRGDYAYIDIAGAESPNTSLRAALTVSYSGGNGGPTATTAPTAPPTATSTPAAPQPTNTQAPGQTNTPVATMPAGSGSITPSAWHNTMHHPGVYALSDRNTDATQFANTQGNFVHWGWLWFEPSEGNFDWHLLAGWINRVRANGQHVGFDIVNFGGRNGGGWIDNGSAGWLGPDYLYNDPNAYVTNRCDGFRIPKYWSDRYLGAYQRMVNSLAAETRDDPAVEFIAIGSGVAGETWPINSASAGRDSQGRICNDLDELKAQGLTIDVWEAAMNRMIDIYVNAFSSPTCTGPNHLCKPLMMQTLPYPDFGADARISRSRVRDYAASKGVGDTLESLEPQRQEARYTWDPNNPDGRGDYDGILDHLGQFPVGFETYVDRVNCRTDPNDPQRLDADTLPYWALLNGLDKHVDYLRLQYMWFTDFPQSTQDDIAWASRYMGVTQSTTPSVWSVLRDYGIPYYRCNPGATLMNAWSHPQVWDYQFYLYHIEPPGAGGTTRPITNDSLFQYMGEGYPPGPYDTRVPAGKQGWSTRRTDQATGNPRMYFNIDDAYLYGGVNAMTVTVTYGDVGNDTWSLHYDSLAGDKVAGTVHKTNSRTWKKAQFTVSDARLANSLYGADLYIDSNNDGDEIIHMVDISGKAIGTWVDVRLNQGWNLVGVPLQLSNASLEAILGPLGANLVSTQAWSNCNTQNCGRGWRAYPGGVNQASQGMAIFVQVNAPTTLRLTGLPAQSTIVQLYTGWNVLGYLGQTTKSFNGAGLPGQIDEVYTVTNSDTPPQWKQWKRNVPGYINTLQTLQPGQAYYVHTTGDTLWDMSR